MYVYTLTEADKRTLQQWGVYVASFIIIILGLVIWGLGVELFGVMIGVDQYSTFDCARDFFWMMDVFFGDTWKIFDLIERSFDLLRVS